MITIHYSLFGIDHCYLTLPLSIIYPEVDRVHGEAAVSRLQVPPHLVLPIKHAHWLARLAPPALAHLVVHQTWQGCAQTWCHQHIIWLYREFLCTPISYN